MELVLHPTSHRVAVAPHRREQVAPFRRALPDRSLQAPLDVAGLLEGAIKLFAKIRVAFLGAAELGEHEQGRQGRPPSIALAARASSSAAFQPAIDASRVAGFMGSSLLAPR